MSNTLKRRYSNIHGTQNSRALLFRTKGKTKTDHPFQPFLEGMALNNRLNELREEANDHHHEAQKAWRGALLHAEKAGIALIEAKRLVGRRVSVGA